MGGGYIYNCYCTLPIEFAGNRPPGAPTWRESHKKFQRQWFRRFVHLGSNCQAMPQECNRIDLDPDVRDAWGVPVARITHSWMPLDLEMANFVADKEKQLLKEAGAIRIWLTPSNWTRAQLRLISGELVFMREKTELRKQSPI